jgi:hypothetical protein
LFFEKLFVQNFKVKRTIKARRNQMSSASLTGSKEQAGLGCALFLNERSVQFTQHESSPTSADLIEIPFFVQQ